MPPLQFELIASSAATTPARLRFVPACLLVSPPSPATKSPGPANTRLHEIIQRVGEICLSPELALVMLFPAQAHQAHLMLEDPASVSDPVPACFQVSENVFDFCHDRPAILDCMGIPTPPATARLSRAFLDQLTSDCLPPPTLVTLPKPVHVCAWNVQSPPRVILYTGEAVPPKFETPPHTLQKILLDERSKRHTPSSIVALDHTRGDDLTAQAIRDALLAYYHRREQPTRTPTRQEPLSSATTLKSIHTQDHTLEEAAVVFIHPPDRNHSTIPLNQSPPWDKDHVDSRYAETQNATNGLRYRDWLCVFANDTHLEKCKLEGHVLDITQFHQALVPWHTPATKEYTNHQTLQWAVSRSSLPLEQRVLHNRPQSSSSSTPEPASQFTSFTRSVKARLLQDIKLLPVPSPLHTVDRLNVSIYTDEPSNQVLVVYAPTSSFGSEDIPNTQLEFVSFSLLPEQSE